MYKLTDYDFAAGIHSYTYRDLNLVLDVNSGAVHMLDEVGRALIEAMIDCRGDIDQARERCSRAYADQQVTEGVSELAELYENGALFSQEEKIDLDLTRVPLKALCLNIAHTCNMRCTYCFASQGDFGLAPGLMSAETGRKALDFLVDRSAGVKQLEVDFFGGEPLLNAGVIRDLVYYGRELEKKSGKRFNFTLTTNALGLDDEIMDFIIEEGIGVILSLDGRPQVNDQCRVLAGGGGSYGQVLLNIKRMVARKPASYYIRGTFTRKNLDFSRDLRHIIDLGFSNLSLEPAIGSSSEYAIQPEDLPRVLEEYDHLTGALWEYHRSGRKVMFFHYNLNLQSGPCLAKRHSGCGAGVDYLAVTPEGDIYPCHQLVGQARFLMGNVKSGEIDQDIKNRFAGNHLEKKKTCRSCWARNFCGGGCHANNFFRQGDIAIPHELSCVLHRKRIEAAIYLEIKKQLDIGTETVC